MSYPGAAPEVQAHLYKSICQPVLTYGMECMSNSKGQFRKMESIQGRLIKQCLGLSKRSHNSAVLKALNSQSPKYCKQKCAELVPSYFLNRESSSQFNAIFTRQVYYIWHYSSWNPTRQGSVHRESPLKCDFRKCGHKEFILKDGIDGHVDSIRLQLHSRNFVDRNSQEHFILLLLTTSM